jgi:hypothetical protein
VVVFKSKEEKMGWKSSLFCTASRVTNEVKYHNFWKAFGFSRSWGRTFCMKNGINRSKQTRIPITPPVFQANTLNEGNQEETNFLAIAVFAIFVETVRETIPKIF